MNEHEPERTASGGAETESNPAPDPAEVAVEGSESGQRCDFCGRTVERVRRVALDGDYERLRTPHRVSFACPECSAEKERDRLG